MQKPDVTADLKNIERLETAIKEAMADKAQAQTIIDQNGYTLYPEQRDERKAKTEKAIIKLKETDNRLIELQSELAAINPSVSIAAIIEHQANIETVQTECNNYLALIDEHQQIITQASIKEDPTSALLAQREKLATDIALGHDKAKELQVLDAKLKTSQANEAVRTDHNKAAIKHAQQTINGLKRRLNTAQEKLADLQGLSKKMLVSLLMNQAEKIAIEFDALTQKMLGKIQDLAAIDLLSTKLGQQSGTELFNVWWKLKIPSMAGNNPDINTDNVQFLATATDSLNQLKQHLLSQGVNLDKVGG